MIFLTDLRKIDSCFDSCPNICLLIKATCSYCNKLFEENFSGLTYAHVIFYASTSSCMQAVKFDSDRIRMLAGRIINIQNILLF